MTEGQYLAQVWKPWRLITGGLGHAAGLLGTSPPTLRRWEQLGRVPGKAVPAVLGVCAKQGLLDPRQLGPQPSAIDARAADEMTPQLREMLGRIKSDVRYIRLQIDGTYPAQRDESWIGEAITAGLDLALPEMRIAVDRGRALEAQLEAERKRGQRLQEEIEALRIQKSQGWGARNAAVQRHEAEVAGLRQQLNMMRSDRDRVLQLACAHWQWRRNMLAALTAPAGDIPQAGV